jgi:hypothetical protein
MARMRVIAGVKAEEIIDSFATSANANPSTESEAPNAWDVAAGYKVMSPDLETRINTHRYGIMPVPLTIARRLDSDNDEIAKVLAEGGQLFYSQAAGATGLEEVTLGKADKLADLPTTPLEDATLGKVVKQHDALTQRLVFAVVGYAQSNHLAFLPQKAWPYYAGYPSPPGHGETKNRALYRPSDSLVFSYQGCTIGLWEGVGSGGPDNGLGTTDGDIAEVFESRTGAPKSGYKPYGLGGSKDEAGAIRYLQSALWYVTRKGLGTDWYDPPAGFVIKTKVAERMLAFKALADGEQWKYVQAFRFLSHAATCMTRWKNLAQLGGQPSAGIGFTIPAATIPSGNSPELVLTHDKIVYFHELCLQMAMLYCASQPYDWGAPRPTQRALFTDHPLIEYDLIGPYLSGTITNTSKSAQQWRPVAARPITTIGRSYEFPNLPIPATLWGDSGNFTLAKPFKAEERCRQLVFWAVDWQSYEDFETAPSGPIDASKYQFAPPMGDVTVSQGAFDARMGGSTWPDHHIYQYRNPEKSITFTDASVPNLPTGSDVTNKRIMNAMFANGIDQGGGLDQRRRFLGRWGADRNFNGLLDRGPLPRSVRIRASEVSRYNFYDPRLTLKLR